MGAALMSAVAGHSSRDFRRPVCPAISVGRGRGRDCPHYGGTGGMGRIGRKSPIAADRSGLGPTHIASQPGGPAALCPHHHRGRTAYATPCSGFVPGRRDHLVAWTIATVDVSIRGRSQGLIVLRRPSGSQGASVRRCKPGRTLFLSNSERFSAGRRSSASPGG